MQNGAANRHSDDASLPTQRQSADSAESILLDPTNQTAGSVQSYRTKLDLYSFTKKSVGSAGAGRDLVVANGVVHPDAHDDVSDNHPRHQIRRLIFFT